MSHIGLIGENLIEYIKADLQTCMDRDPKELYHKAMDNMMSEFTGISSPNKTPSRLMQFLMRKQSIELSAFPI